MELVSECHSLNTQELGPLGNDKETQHSCFHRTLFLESLNIRIGYVFENHHLVLCVYNCFFFFFCIFLFWYQNYFPKHILNVISICQPDESRTRGNGEPQLLVCPPSSTAALKTVGLPRPSTETRISENTVLESLI